MAPTDNPHMMSRDEFLTHLDSEQTFFEAMQKQAREIEQERDLKTLDR